MKENDLHSYVFYDTQLFAEDKEKTLCHRFCCCISAVLSLLFYAASLLTIFITAVLLTR
jgi:hypothetical protein